MEIILDIDFPAGVRAYVGDLLDECVWLMPVWMQRLRVGWCGEEGTIATMQTEKDYRYCRLTIHPEFLQHDGSYQRQVLYHELLHNFNNPVTDYAEEVFEMLCDKLENEELKTVVIKELKRKREAATEDFAFVIANKFKDAG
ncbi:MAG: hypothetical protein M3367_03035 [Acidobacteriota bacterium]|nr:hypothetical protein [Acidobacteriota bacterium]